MTQTLKKEQALSIYRKLVMIRLAEERVREEYFRDEMKTPVHLGIGAEGIAVGVNHCLPKATKTFGTYRNHALYLAMTEDLEGFFAELYGKATGPAKGKAGSMHLSAPAAGLMATSAVVGTTIPLAVGAALANSYVRSPAFTAAFFGDGSLEEGVFWESFNFACLKRLRILFVCEDNGLAIHAHAADRRGFRSIPEAVKGFDCYMHGADGSDLAGVIQTTRRAIRKMERDPKPAFLHYPYFRFLEHVGPGEDFEFGYRKRPPQEKLDDLDPVLRWEKELRENKVTEREIQGVRDAVKKLINQSITSAQKAPFAAPSELYTDVFA